MPVVDGLTVVEVLDQVLRTGLPELLIAKVGTLHADIGAGQAVSLVADRAWALFFGSDGRLLD